MEAVGGNAGSWITWEGGGGDREEVRAGLGYAGYWMEVVPFT
jgi:hypothetical protein